MGDLAQLEDQGELHALISIHEGPSGNGVSITGAFADRLEYASYSLIKALDAVNDMIAAGGKAGHSFAKTVRARIRPPGTKPSALFEREDVTNFGGL